MARRRRGELLRIFSVRGVFAVFFFDLGELLEFLVLDCIGLISDVTVVRCFWAEQEHEQELDDEEDLEHVEEPEPAKMVENLAADD